MLNYPSWWFAAAKWGPEQTALGSADTLSRSALLIRIAKSPSTRFQGARHQQQ